MPSNATVPLDRACAWVTRHLAVFRFGAPEVEVGEPFFAELKAIAELAHAGDVLRRAPDGRWHALGDAWLAHAWHAIDQGERIRGLIARDPRLVPAAITFVPFHLAGFACPALVALILAQLARVTMSPLEWALTLPACEILGIPATAPRRAAGRPASVLDRLPPVDEVTRDGAYVLAHECFYATRWGHAPPAYGPEVAAWVAAALPVLVARAAGDADLLAELAVACRVTGVAIAPRAFDDLTAAQTEDGNLVAPPLATTQHRRFAHPSLPRTYHTTLAAIMAWAR